MLRIRSFVLDGVALLGIAVGVIAGIGGYVHNLPGRLKHMVSAIERLDVDMTGSINHQPAPSSTLGSAPRP